MSVLGSPMCRPSGALKKSARWATNLSPAGAMGVPAEHLVSRCLIIFVPEEHDDVTHPIKCVETPNCSELTFINFVTQEFPMRIKNIHPGEVLLEEFLKPIGISAYRLSKDILIPQTRIAAIIKGTRRITADTALRLSIYFGNSPKFWLGLQDDYDIEEERNVQEKELDTIKKFAIKAA